MWLFLAVDCISISDHEHTLIPLRLCLYLPTGTHCTQCIRAAQLSGQGVDVTGGAYGDVKEGGSVNL